MGPSLGEVSVKKRHVLFGAVLLFGAVGCSDSKSGSTTTSAPGGASSITVGVLAPQTGFAANYGPEAQQGIDLALAELGVDSSVTVKIVTADEDVLDPSATLERLKKMV